MAFLAFRAANVLDGDAVLIMILKVLLEVLIDAVEFVAVRSGRIREVDLGSTVAIDTPAHAQRCKLMYLIHCLDGTVTGLTLNFAGCGVLGMAKKDVVGKVVDLYPFDRPGIFGMVGAGFGVIANITVQFLDLRGSVDFAAVLAEKFWALCIFIDGRMTVHTDV